MAQVCWYFQLHQPYRLSDFSVFDIGSDHSYFKSTQLDDNRLIFQKVAHKSYLPMLAVLEEVLATVPNFCCTLSASGVFLEQAAEYCPAVLEALQRITATGRVEWLAETYYHSLAALFSPSEFQAQVAAHSQVLADYFQATPQVFRNTELVYSNQVAEQVAGLGFRGMLTEAVDRYLHGRDKTQLYTNTTQQLTLLLKHAQLSDDIAFRFSERSWQWYPLGADRFREWVEVYPESAYINLFMDFETFGEHQWADSGIFDFFKILNQELAARPYHHFVTPSQVCLTAEPSQLPGYDVPQPISWADIDRDLTAWIDNAYQRDTLRLMYELEPAILASQDQQLLADWRRLQTSDHFYYMCTKWAADGDVHAYFSPYQSPHEAYRRFSIVLADIKRRVTGPVPTTDKPRSNLLH